MKFVRNMKVSILFKITSLQSLLEDFQYSCHWYICLWSILKTSELFEGTTRLISSDFSCMEIVTMETTVEMTNGNRWKVTNTVMKGTSVELRGMVWSIRVKNMVKVKNKVKHYVILSPETTGIRLDTSMSLEQQKWRSAW